MTIVSIFISCVRVISIHSCSLHGYFFYDIFIYFNCPGARRIVDCMDVTTQKAETMTLGQFQKYYTDTKRDRLLNVISLEFSHTKLDELVQAPKVVSVCYNLIRVVNESLI